MADTAVTVTLGEYPHAFCAFCGRPANAAVASGTGTRLYVCPGCRLKLSSAIAPATIPPMISAADPVGVSDIAVRCGVSVNTVQSWRSRGQLPSPRWIVSRQPVWNWNDVAPDALTRSRRLGEASRADGTLVVQVESLPRTVSGLVFAVPGHGRHRLDFNDYEELRWGGGESRKWFSPPIGRVAQVFVKYEYQGKAHIEKRSVLVTGDPGDSELMNFGPDQSWRVRILCSRAAPVRARPALELP